MSIIKSHFDILVIGAGHAGVEAALAGCRLGLRVGLITSNLDRIGYMSCNPSIGGLAKGHMVREMDVLGGVMGWAADQTCIQFKRLNARKGPAVRGSRAQCDKTRYSAKVVEVLRAQNNLQILGGEAVALILSGDRCEGVVLEDQTRILSFSTILTTGTFLRAVMYVGLEKSEGGRIGDRSSMGLSDQLSARGFNLMRLKTGTPPRLQRDSIDWSKLAPQYGDEVFEPFSMMSERRLRLPQVACFLGYTNEQTHAIIRSNLDKSPMFCGIIEGTGPRYCPSIEDKVTRFAEKEKHQTFLEPEGINDDSIYLQGISTSLPRDVQEQFVRTIPGLEAVRFLCHGYAVEYDCVDSLQLHSTLETRGIENLYLAGQINGTSGYEEAGAQGLLAGVNAGLKVLGKEPFILGRDQAYMGVLIDDLVTRGTKEPYRMMTSRAEFRLVLREDNTIERLGDLAEAHGLIGKRQTAVVRERKVQRESLLKALQEKVLVPNEITQKKMTELRSTPLSKPTRGDEFVRRAEIEIWDMERFGIQLPKDPSIVEAMEIELKYSGYIARQMEMVQQMQRMEGMLIPHDLSFSAVRGLSSEEIEKLARVRPRTLAQAQRISGVNPSAIQALLFHVVRARRQADAMEGRVR